MEKLLGRIKNNLKNPQSGMELVQVAILIAIAVLLGLAFRTQLKSFVDGVFGDLMNANF